MSTDSVRLPLFPLGSVLFPGQSIPLRIFEERYRAMVRDLLTIDDPTERLFASVAIREGYEVGSTGRQSLHRIGCTVQLTDVEPVSGDGYDVVGVVRGRFRLDALDGEGEYAVATGTLLPDRRDSLDDTDSADLTGRVLRSFERYREEIGQWREDVHPGRLPRDPAYLAWSLAGALPVPLPQRQALLEAESTAERLTLLDTLLREEVRAMSAIPSLPATEVARTRWSPN